MSAEYYVGPLTYIVERGATNVILHVPITDNSRGALLGIAYNTSGLAGRYVVGGGTLSGALTFETIATLGTYAAPSTNAKVRLKEMDAINFVGHYELHLHNDWFATGRYIYLILRGATGMAQCHLLIQLTGANLNDGVRAGLTALPNAAAAADGGLFTRGTGAGQINQAANGQIDANIVRVGNDAQSAIDLKDFADAGYDPAVHGVALKLDQVNTAGNDPTHVGGQIRRTHALAEGTVACKDHSAADPNWVHRDESNANPLIVRTRTVAGTIETVTPT
jgi:hypothetical protein